MSGPRTKRARIPSVTCFPFRGRSLQNSRLARNPRTVAVSSRSCGELTTCRSSVRWVAGVPLTASSLTRTLLSISFIPLARSEDDSLIVTCAGGG
jgi:hypothetical protein